MLDSEKYKTKRYLHFDHKVKIEKVESYVTNPKRIAMHSFLPFIHYVSSFNKNIGKKNSDMNNRPIKPKNRDIMYAGHLDNFIYKYYADEILNKKYNRYISDDKCMSKNIDKCVTAYRSNKEGKSNIDFAAEIINDIVDFKEAYILVGDFTKFFDQIDHKLLKENLMEVLEVEKLSNDWFNVYKSITKYGYYEKSLLIKKFGTDKQIRRSGKRSYFDGLKKFREFQHQYPTKKNGSNDKEKCKEGIPQGTAISAVFANVYALKFDLDMNKIANQYSGLYRRYSDDFILVLPRKQQRPLLDEEFQNIEIEVRKLAAENKRDKGTGLLSQEKNRRRLSPYKPNRAHIINRLDNIIIDGTRKKSDCSIKFKRDKVPVRDH